MATTKKEYHIPYGKQAITQKDIDAVIETLQSDFLTQGPKVKEFEKKFASYVGASYAIATSNATAALHLSVLALNLKPGDRIITTPITFAATANCARFVGAEVWFADIDPDTYLLSLNAVKKLVESKPKGFFKGIIGVDFAGLPLNLEQFSVFAKQHDLWIIEDACHAPGGFFTDSKGAQQKCGNGKFAEVSVFSFHPVKHIACGEGGMVTTNDKSLAEKIKMLSTHGITKNNLSKNDGGWYYEMHELGFNYRLTDLQSALGITQLKKNEAGVEKRNQIAEIYKNAFEGKIKFQHTSSQSRNAHHLFVVEVKNRKALYEFLKNCGIYTQIHYIPLHFQPYYKSHGHVEVSLEHAETYYSQCISLPMYPTLTEDEQAYVIEKVLKFYE